MVNAQQSYQKRKEKKIFQTNVCITAKTLARLCLIKINAYSSLNQRTVSDFIEINPVL